MPSTTPTPTFKGSFTSRTQFPWIDPNTTIANLSNVTTPIKYAQDALKNAADIQNEYAKNLFNTENAQLNADIKNVENRLKNEELLLNTRKVNNDYELGMLGLEVDRQNAAINEKKAEAEIQNIQNTRLSNLGKSYGIPAYSFYMDQIRSGIDPVDAGNNTIQHLRDNAPAIKGPNNLNNEEFEDVVKYAMGHAMELYQKELATSSSAANSKSALLMKQQEELSALDRLIDYSRQYGVTEDDLWKDGDSFDSEAIARRASRVLQNDNASDDIKTFVANYQNILNNTFATTEDGKDPLAYSSANARKETINNTAKTKLVYNKLNTWDNSLANLDAKTLQNIAEARSSAWVFNNDTSHGKFIHNLSTFSKSLHSSLFGGNSATADHFRKMFEQYGRQKSQGTVHTKPDTSLTNNEDKHINDGSQLMNKIEATLFTGVESSYYTDDVSIMYQNMLWWDGKEKRITNDKLYQSFGTIARICADNNARADSFKRIFDSYTANGISKDSYKDMVDEYYKVITSLGDPKLDLGKEATTLIAHGLANATSNVESREFLKEFVFGDFYHTTRQ